MTSRHGSEGGRRGIAKWIPVTIVIAVLIAAATTAYFLIVNNDDEAASCSTQVTVPVIVSPGATGAITDAAAFNATAPVARSACVTTTVTEMSGPAAGTALGNNWSGQSGPAPAVWVPDSIADLEAVEAGDSALTAGRDTAPMATSPVVLAVRSDDAGSLTGLSWQDLGAAAGPNGSVTLPSGQHLVLALPNPTINRATSYALQSVVAAGTGGPVDPAAVTAAGSTLQKVAAGGPNPQPATTKDALDLLAAGNAGFSAVPVVASDLAQFSEGTAGLTAISPSGATVGDEVYPVTLSAGWVNPTMDDAAALFLAYLRGPGGTAAFTENGLTVAGAATTAPSTAAPSTAAPSTAAPSTSGSSTAGADGSALLPDAGPQVASALAATIGSVPGG